MALPLGELSPQVTERVLQPSGGVSFAMLIAAFPVFAALNILAQRERQALLVERELLR